MASKSQRQQAHISYSHAIDSTVDTGMVVCIPWQPNREYFISVTTTVMVELSTANFGLAITESSKKVCPGDWDNDGQPEMARWLTKPEILISLELWQIGSEFHRQI